MLNAAIYGRLASVMHYVDYRLIILTTILKSGQLAGLEYSA